MIQLNNLILVTDEEKQAVLKHSNITEEELNETIQHLLDWSKKSGFPVDGKYIMYCFYN